MKDDIEYLTGENKELHLKCKDVCFTKANLQLELAKLRKQLKMEQERAEMSVIVDEAIDVPKIDASDIVTARNIDDMFQPVEEVKNEESSRLPDRAALRDFDDDQDSELDVINQMEEDGGFTQHADDVESSPVFVKLQNKL